MTEHLFVERNCLLSSSLHARLRLKQYSIPGKHKTTGYYSLRNNSYLTMWCMSHDSLHSSILMQQQNSRLEHMFAMIDADHDGMITHQELRAFCG